MKEPKPTCSICNRKMVRTTGDNWYCASCEGRAKASPTFRAWRDAKLEALGRQP